MVAILPHSSYSYRVVKKDHHFISLDVEVCNSICREISQRFLHPKQTRASDQSCWTAPVFWDSPRVGTNEVIRRVTQNGCFILYWEIHLSMDALGVNNILYKNLYNIFFYIYIYIHNKYIDISLFILFYESICIYIHI
jgi:hypothetical protein